MAKIVTWTLLYVWQKFISRWSLHICLIVFKKKTSIFDDTSWGEQGHIQDFLQYLFWEFSLGYAPGFTLENFVGMENFISWVVKKSLKHCMSTFLHFNQIWERKENICWRKNSLVGFAGGSKPFEIC